MKGSKEMFVRMREEDYLRIPKQQRDMFLSEKTIVPDQHRKLYDSDEVYKKLYKEYRKLKKKVEDYRYDKRHSFNRSNS